MRYYFVDTIEEVAHVDKEVVIEESLVTISAEEDFVMTLDPPIKDETSGTISLGPTESDTEFVHGTPKTWENAEMQVSWDGYGGFIAECSDDGAHNVLFTLHYTAHVLADPPYPAEAMKFNGLYLEDQIEGYRTLYVKGREAFIADVDTFETGIRDGSRLHLRKFPERVITVGYQLICESPESFREAYIALNSLMNTTDAELIFEDEPDKFFIGTPVEPGDVEPGLNSIVAELSFLCNDPFKYSVEEYEVGTVSQAGTVKTVSDAFDTSKMTVVDDEWYAYQTLTYTPTSAVVDLLGGDADQYSLDEHYMVDVANKRVYVCEEIFTVGGFDAWEYETVQAPPSNTALMVVDYNGTYKAFPTLEVALPMTQNAEGEDILKDRCGYIAFYNDHKKIIQIGDAKEAAGEDFQLSEALINQTFNASVPEATSWARDNTRWYGEVATVDRAMRIGSWSAAGKTEKAITPNGYGSGTGWYGVSITNYLAPDINGIRGAYDWSFTYKQRIAIGGGKNDTKQLGQSQVLLLSDDTSEATIVAGVVIQKGSVGKNGTIRLIVNDQLRQSISVSLTNDNTSYGWPYKIMGTRKVKYYKTVVASKKRVWKRRRGYVWEYTYKKVAYYRTESYWTGKWSTPICNTTIIKDGNTVTFTVCNKKYSFTDDEITNLMTKYVKFGFLAYQGYPALTTNTLCTTKFVKNFTSWSEVPNRFQPGDVITADCNSGEIYYRRAGSSHTDELGARQPDLGALGNDWEEFCLLPGKNQIGVVYSDYTENTPQLKLRYRKVFL